MAIILLIQNNGKISKLPLKNRTITFGRSSKSDIKIDDQMMSGQHFSLTLTQNRILTVKDLESTNGTFLNGSKIENSKIFIGDQISVGATVFTLDKASMNKHEVNYFTPDERTSVRFIKPPTNQKTLSIKRDIYEVFDVDEGDPKTKKEKAQRKAPSQEPDISINFDNDGELKPKKEKPKKVEEPSKKDITTSEVIDSSKLSESDLERKAYQATGATKFIKLDKESLKSTKKKNKKKKGKKNLKKKKKDKKPKSLLGKILGLFKK